VSRRVLPARGNLRLPTRNSRPHGNPEWNRGIPNNSEVGSAAVVDLDGYGQQQRVSFLQFVESSAPRWNRRGSLDLRGHGEVHRPVSVNEGEEVLQPAKRSDEIN
jgi:hypothetical protein